MTYQWYYIEVWQKDTIKDNSINICNEIAQFCTLRSWFGKKESFLWTVLITLFKALNVLVTCSLPFEENDLLKQGKEIRHLLRSICVRTKIDYELVLILWKQMYPTVVVREYDINFHFHITYIQFLWATVKVAT